MPITSDSTIKQKLIIQNPDYVSALKSGRSTRFIPAKIPLFSKEIRRKNKKLNQEAIMKEHEVLVPQGVRQFYPANTNPPPTHPPTHIPAIQGTLRQDQIDIATKLMKHRYAFGHISTGLGKTWILSYIASTLQRKTLIVVDTTSALTQMQKQIFDILQVNARIPNKKKNLDSPITIWNIHSLQKLDLQSFGLVLYDEADKYLASPNYRHTINQIESEYAYAFTGTLKVNQHPENIFPIFFGAKEELLYKHMTPSYIQLNSTFNEHSFKHFADLTNKVYYNEERNKFILSTIDTAMKTHTKALIFCRQVEHAKLIQEGLNDMGYKTFLLIGEVPQDEREHIRQEIIAHKGKCILIGSVQLCGRGFDIPELDLAVLTSAEKFESSIQQYIGRIIRPFPGKKQCTFIDICDPLNGILKNQGRERLKTFKLHFH